MHELSESELYKALEYAKSIDENEGRQIIEQFQLNQTALAQTIFGIFPNVIAEQDQSMAELFLDLCFDVICVFQKAFGPLPSQESMGYGWLEKNAALLDTELQSLISDRPMDDKFRDKLQHRYMERVINGNSQTGLIKFMNAAIDDFASENPVRVKAIRITQTMIFVVIQLFGNMYDHANQK
jgi:hypothetical protein